MIKLKLGDTHLGLQNLLGGPPPIVWKDMTLEDVHKGMLRLMGEESTNHYSMGLLYNYTVDNKLAELAGFKNGPEYFAKHLPDVSLTALNVYGKVASDFSEEQARRFGTTCLFLLGTYSEAADVTLDFEAPGDMVIEVPGENGEVQTKTFGACSVEDLRRAIQRKRKPSSSKPLPGSVIVQVDAYRDAVMAQFTKKDPVRVQLRNHRGRAVVDFKGIPLDQVAKLGAVLVVPSSEPVSEPAPQQQESQPPPLAQ